MDKIAVVAHVPFHRHEVPSAEFNMRNPAWWKRRAEIFRAYTLASFERQSDLDFALLLTMAEEDMETGITAPVLDAINSSTLSCLYGYGGAILEEPYQDCQWSLAPNQYAWFCEGYGGKGNPPWLVRLQIDSDDMYAPGVIEAVKAETPSEGLMLHWDAGWEYGLDENDRRMAWIDSPKGPPSFLAEFYPQAALQDAASFAAYRERWQFNCYHHRTHMCPNNRVMQQGQFLQLIHGSNSSLGWSNPHTQRRIKNWVTVPEERQSVFDIFGMEGTP